MRDGLVIAVASGKGGTGKTTVATNLAWYVAGLGQKAQYLDCDVEEPNGHIFLRPNITETSRITADVPQVDLEKCTGCGNCGRICQYGAIVCLGRKVLTFEQLCHSCGGCWLVCPESAIAPRPLPIGDIQLGSAQDVDFVSGRLRIGSVRTPSLIKQVKSHIRQQHVAIIDVPPGTSCAVVEALKGADFLLLVTEPTPFGLNDLKLAVALARRMDLPFAVIVNRHGIGNRQVHQYCRSENIQIVMTLPDDRQIAEAYSRGELIVDVLNHYKSKFAALYENLSDLCLPLYEKR